MYIKKFQIENFKAFQNITIYFNKDVNILTGRNNAGKTTILEALSLWYECFTKLVSQAKRGEKNYTKGEWVLGPTSNRYFPFEQINSVRSPNFEDIFHDCNRKNKIKLCVALQNDANEIIEIRFLIGESGSNYVIELEKFTAYDFHKFNEFLKGLPSPFSIYYASPVATVDATEDYQSIPQIEKACLIQKSGSALRNRLFQISRFATLFDLFQRDLAYILFNDEKQIQFEINFNETKDTRIIVRYKILNHERFKDIALLGSGTLQLIEILLNFYQADSYGKDFKLILLDEPDSYIHRDIQKRLIEVITRFSKKSQVIISTHNESFIRSSPIEQLFHLDGRLIGEYKPINESELEKLQPRFKGIYPSLINPIIRNVGEITGLDFVNAIECDRLIFVEGEDDARALNVLLKHQIGSTRKRYMFWVMGGISEIFENILSYKTVFSAIKNGQSLWAKSCVVFDKDYLSHEHQELIVKEFKTKYQLDVFSCESYTFESTVFENLDTLSILLSSWIQSQVSVEINKEDVALKLKEEYTKVRHLLETRYTDVFIEQESQRYKTIREKTNELFGRGNVIRQNDIQLTTLVRTNLSHTIDSSNFHWLMRKEEVEAVFNPIVQMYGLNFSCETDFIELIKQVSKSTWMNQWNFLNKI